MEQEKHPAGQPEDAEVTGGHGGSQSGSRTGPGEADPIRRLRAIMAALRDPETGCPWDIRQSFKTIAPYTIEEAYEVADAIDRADMADLKEELGDLLLQVVYHSQMASECGLFDFDDVAASIADKMVRRHPHVFGADRQAASGPVQWEKIKEEERAAKHAGAGERPSNGLFDDVPAGLPALQRSAKLQRRAARIGFDWPAISPLEEKVEEEWAELRAEIAALKKDEAAQQRAFEEFGDLLFVLVNLGLHLGIDADAALRAANQKFIRRMSLMAEAAAGQGRQLSDLSFEEIDVLWLAAKSREK